MNAAGQLRISDLVVHVFSRWIAEISTVVVLTPLILAWARPSLQRTRALALEHVVAIGVFLFSNGLFAISPAEWNLSRYLIAAFPISLFILWAVFRSSVRVVLSLIMIRTVAVLWAGLHGKVPLFSGVLGIPLLSANLGAQGIVYFLLRILVSDRERSQQALSHSSEQLATIADLAPVGIILSKPDRSVTFVNKYLKNLFGVTEEDLSHGGWLRIVHPEDQEKLSNEIRTHAPGFGDGVTECRAFTRKGETRWLLRAGKPVRDRIGRITSYINVFTDITEQRRSAESYRQTFEHAPDAILLADTDGKYIYENPAFSRMLGYRPGEIIGKTPFDIVDPKQYPELKEYLNSVMKEGEVGTGNYRLKRKNGTFLIAEVNSKRMPDGRRLVFFRDTSERSAMEAELRESEEKYRRIVELASDGIFLADAEKWIDVNSAGCRMLGYTREELIGMRPEDFVVPEDLQLIAEARARDGAHSHTDHIRMRLIKKDGTYFPVEMSTLDWPDGHRQAFVIDITERVKMEESLLKSREQLQAFAARIQTAREEEAARISRELHDELGQSLTVLKMQASRMDRNLAREAFKDPRALREELAAIMESIDANMQTVRRISTELRPSVFDHFGLAAALEWQASEFEKKTEIACGLRINCDLKSLDRERSFAVFRVLQEALVNVARHSRASKVEISALKEAGHVLFEIHDNGRGITPAQIADPKALGLLGMRERLMPFAGSVDFHGEPGKGTKVKVSLPV